MRLAGQVAGTRDRRRSYKATMQMPPCDIMTMPGLPKEPAAAVMDIEQDGRIRGLF